MEFAWNTQKNNMTDIKGLEKEQDREGKISNEEIDLKKTHLNYDLVKSDLNLYQRVKQRVDEVRPVSRIQKNSVVDYSNIITVPKEQCKEWGIEKSKEYLKEVYNYFCKEFGAENVVSAKVHLDETTPHMHLHFVPVSEEGKLQARKVMTPQRINKIHTDAPKYLQERGYDVVRGMGKTEESLEIHKFKAEKLKDDIKGLELKLNALKNDYTAVKDIRSCIYDINHIEVKKGLIGSKITISENDYKTLVGLAKQGVYNRDKIRDLESDNSRLKDNLDNHRQVSNSNAAKISELREENSKLKKALKDIKEQGKAMYETLKDHNLIPEAQQRLNTNREAEKVAEKVLKKMPTRGFEIER